MLLVTDENKAKELAAMGVEVACHINGNIHGRDVVPYVSQIELAAVVADLKAHGAKTVMPLPDSVPLADVPEKLRRLYGIKVVNHPREGEPSKSLLKHARQSVIRQTTHLWDNALDQQSVDFATGTNTQRELADLWMISAAGGLCIGTFEASVAGLWKEPPIINGLGVLPPGAGKTPLNKAVTGPVFDAQLEVLTSKTINANGADKFVWGDTTTESACKDMARTGKGGLRNAEEFDAILGKNMTRYKAASDRHLLKEFWNGAPGIIDRVGNAKSLAMQCMGMAMMGGIQPALLHLLFDNIDDGWSDRIILIYPEANPPSRVNHNAQSDTVWRGVVNQLIKWRKDNADKITIPLTEDAFRIFDDHRLAVLEKYHSAGRELDGWTAKSFGHIARISLIITLCDGALRERIPTEITAETVGRAIEYMKLLNSHRRRAKLETGKPSVQQIAVDLARYCLESGARHLDTFELRYGGVVAGLRDEDTLRKVLVELRAANWITTDVPRRNDAPMPATVALSPKVFQLGV